ncbi:MAG: BMP family ABC transporter substrate-binding protein [Eubacterium sp.]|nr:BMP family ABC transporter substrate-binding protein [Eubacterium sp.]
MKKLLAFVLAAMMVIGLCACGSSAGGEGSTGAAAGGEGVSAENIKVGVIYIGDENEGYTESHMKGVQEMKEELGLSDEQVIEKTLIPEGEECYDAAADLAEAGCNIIFATSFGHESYLIQAAQQYPDIQFCHATGTQAAASGLPNMHNYFDNIYEARYVSGVVAGLKLNEMIESGQIKAEEAKIGYVGAFPYAEVVSGYTAFYLGARSQCPTATMEVKYTGSWADMSKEKECAESLIADKCVLIGQHADTTGAPTACEAKKVPCVGYNVDMIPTAPNYALTSSTNNWGPYYTYAVQAVINGEDIVVDYSTGLEAGTVKITDLNDKAVAKGTKEKVEEVEAAIKDGSLHVFDTSTFTIGGKTMEELVEAGDKDILAVKDYIADGYYHESDVESGRISAPSFGFVIDGIDSQNTDK